MSEKTDMGGGRISSILRGMAGGLAIGVLAVGAGNLLAGLFGTPSEISALGGEAPAVVAAAPQQSGSDKLDRNTPSKTVDKESISPEIATGKTSKATVSGKDFMVVTAHPAASQVAASILRDGGTAADAAIAAQLVLNLVEPQSSGIGGGGFLLYWDAKDSKLTSYDGREYAPAGIDPASFLTPAGDPKDFMDAVIGGSSIGVPGIVRMLERVHTDHGKIDWADLFAPAIGLAQKGFPVSPRLYGLLADDDILPRDPVAGPYFYFPDGSPKPVGTVLRNPDFASALEEIAKGGADAFYRGRIASDIVQTVGRGPVLGTMTLSDLADYEAKVRPNLCAPFRTLKVCGMPPPSSGGLTVLETLGLLNLAGPMPDVNTNPTDAIQRVGEAMRFAFADRDRYIGDPDFVNVPSEGLLSQSYLTGRSGMMDFGTGPKGKALPGIPPGWNEARADDAAIELPGTSHISIIDRYGNALSFTTSIETAFGSHRMVDGFLLNNQLTDFSWKSQDAGGNPVANRIEPRKRPRSSMAPTIAFDSEGKPAIVVGSPGGSRIIGYVVDALIASVDFRLSPQEAVSFPHFVNRNHGLELEEGSTLEVLKPDLEARGYEVSTHHMTSGLHMIERSADGTLLGGADPRREGLAVSEGNVADDWHDAFNFIENGADTAN